MEISNPLSETVYAYKDFKIQFSKKPREIISDTCGNPEEFNNPEANEEYRGYKVQGPTAILEFEDGLKMYDTSWSMDRLYMKTLEYLLPRRILKNREWKFPGMTVVFCCKDFGWLHIFKRDIDGQLVTIMPRGDPGSMNLVIRLDSDYEDYFYSYTPKEKDSQLEVHYFFTPDSSHVMPSGITIDVSKTIKGRFINESIVEYDFFTNIQDADKLVDKFKREESVIVGPCDYRNYKVIEDLKDDELVVQLRLDGFRKFLEDVAGLKLEGVLKFQMRHCQAGSYQILNEKYKEPNGLDVILSFVEGSVSDPNDDSGSTVYLDEDGNKVATIKPIHNKIALAYRVEGCNRFLSYTSAKHKDLHIYQILMTFKVIE